MDSTMINKPINSAKLSNLLNEKRNGLSVRKFMRDNEKFGIAPHAWRAWESGETKPSMDSLVKLANLFGLTIEDFLAKIESKDEEKIDYIRPVREYNKKETRISQNFISPVDSILTDQEKEVIAIRLLSEIKKSNLVLNLLNNLNYENLIEFFVEKITELKLDSNSVIQDIIDKLKLSPSEKIVLATKILTNSNTLE